MAAPIAFFVYNRPEHTEKTLRALQANSGAEDSELYVFCDGPKSNATEIDIRNIEKTRTLFQNLKGFKEVNLIFENKNKGLADSIIDGINFVLNCHDSIIVLEDDIVTSTSFLTFMNWALNTYKDSDKVMHVSAYWIPDKANEKLPEFFFTNLATCWGWGTWKCSWKFYCGEIEKVETRLKGQLNKFNGGGKGNFIHQIECNRDGRMKTWNVFWYASIFCRGGLSLHPRQSFTNNIGHDDSGEHCFTTEKYNWSELSLIDKPKDEIDLKLNQLANDLFFEFTRRLLYPNFLEKLARRIKRFALQ